MEELKTKRCSKCGCEKQITEFHKSSKSPDGLQSYCKECFANVNHKSYVRRKYDNSTITADASPFAQMQPREIIAEIRTRINWLRSNGWTFEGKLTYTQVKEIEL